MAVRTKKLLFEKLAYYMYNSYMRFLYSRHVAGRHGYKHVSYFGKAAPVYPGQADCLQPHAFRPLDSADNIFRIAAGAYPYDEVTFSCQSLNLPLKNSVVTKVVAYSSHDSCVGIQCNGRQRLPVYFEP